MSKFRIRKEGREFTASRLETLQELARRGLLRADDPVSVDQGSYRPAQEIQGLAAVLASAAPATDPWRHWGEADEDLDGVDDVLTSFLDQLGAGSAPEIGDPPPVGPSSTGTSREAVTLPPAAVLPRPGSSSFRGPRPIRRSARSPDALDASERVPHDAEALDPAELAPAEDEAAPEPLDPAELEPAPAAPEPLDPAELEPAPAAPEPLDPAELEPAPDAPEPLDPAELSPAPAAPKPLDPADLRPSPPEAGAIDPEARPPNQADSPGSATGRAGLDEAESHAPPAAPRDAPPPQQAAEAASGAAADVPVSFSEWIETKGGSESGRLLENFGRYDDGVVVAARGGRELFNPWRVLLTVLIGAALIGSYSIYVATAASTHFPTEEELAKRVPGGFRANIKPDLPVREGGEDEREAELFQRSAADRALRDSLQGQIIHFSNREGLEDALFQELLNARVSPLSVEVEALELRGGTELGEVPVRANVTVKLSAPRGAEYGDANFQRTLKTAWMLLGKYQAQGRIRFEGATVVVADPLPWDELYDGKRLLGLWNGQVQADDLFLGEP